MKTTKNNRSELLARCAELLQDFKGNLVDKNVQPNQYSLQLLVMHFQWSSRAKVVPGPGKHSIYTHFPKDRLEDENYKGFLQKTYWYSCGQSGKFGDLIATDHKVLSEGCELPHNHRYVVVAQDLATQWGIVIPM